MMAPKHTEYSRCQRAVRQSGFSLMEAMISLALSVVVVAAMVSLMGNSMGTATRIIQMSQLTDEMRNAISMMTRDVRRANYSPNSIYCYGDPECTVAGGPAWAGTELEVVSNNCFTFGLVRPDYENPGEFLQSAGAFRLSPSGDGSIEMWVQGELPDSAWCDDPDGAAEKITDPQTYNIAKFQVYDTPPPDSDNLNCLLEDDFSNVSSLTRTSTSVIAAVTATQREVWIRIEGELLIDPSVNRCIEDVVRVRNDFIDSVL